MSGQDFLPDMRKVLVAIHMDLLMVHDLEVLLIQ